MSKKPRKYVFPPMSREARAALNKLKAYGDSYSTVVLRLVEAYQEKVMEDLAAQNIDDKRDENG